jgi:hypothetical protein
VEACPAEALTYVGWRDLTDKIPPRIMTTAQMLEERAMACQECHMPGQQKNVRQGFGMLMGASRGGRPVSAGEFGFRWIDIAGSILLPVGLAFVAIHAVVQKVTKK